MFQTVNHYLLAKRLTFVYKVYELLDKHITYSIFTFVIVNELQSFKIRVSCMIISKCKTHLFVTIFCHTFQRKDFQIYTILFLNKYVLFDTFQESVYNINQSICLSLQLRCSFRKYVLIGTKLIIILIVIYAIRLDI